MRPAEITKLNSPIRRPDEPKHWMKLVTLDYPVAATFKSLTLALSEQVLLLQEVGRSAYPPVLYFPREDVSFDYLTASEKITRCPLKGQTEYFNVSALAELHINSAWSYREVLNFDPRLELLRNTVAFDPAVISLVEYDKR
jgi:uncharacterized protein (DUF427 family)